MKYVSGDLKQPCRPYETN